MNSDFLNDLNTLEKRIFGREAFSKDALRRHMDPSGNFSFFWLMDEKQECILAYGTVHYRPGTDKCRLYNLAVHPDHRSQGLAKSVMSWFFQEARARGRTSMTLEVRADSVPAIAFYWKLGFSKISVKNNYYHDGMTAMVMSKKL